MTNTQFDDILDASFHLQASITSLKNNCYYYFNCADLPCMICPLYTAEDSLCRVHDDILSQSQAEYLKTHFIELFV